MGDKDLKWKWGPGCVTKDGLHRFEESEKDLWCPYCGICFYKGIDPEIKLIMQPENKIDIRC